MQIDQNINSYVLLQMISHYLKEKIAENHYSNQLLLSNKYLEISNEMVIFLAFQELVQNHHSHAFSKQNIF